jgi:mycothiol synthase
VDLQPLDGVQWRPLTTADLPAWHRMVAAAEAVDEPAERYTVEDLKDELTGPGVDPALDSIAACHPDGEIVAAGLSTARPAGPTMRRYDLDGAVHPAHRGRGLGRRLLARQEARARRRHEQEAVAIPGHIGLGADERQDDVRRLAERAGFEAHRWYTDLRRPVTDPPAAPELPDGVRLVPFSPDLDERVRLAHNEAWLDHWGSYPRTAEKWRAWVTGHRNFRRDLSHVALATAAGGPPQVAGYVVNSTFEQDWPAQGFTEGWSLLVGVRRPWRGRGVATALLIASIGSFAAAGLQSAGLDVDSENPTGALQLYLRLGYQPQRRTVLLAKELPPAAGPV